MPASSLRLIRPALAAAAVAGLLGAAVAPAAAAKAQPVRTAIAAAAAIQTQVVVGPLSQAGQESVAKCPSGTAVLSGGYHADSFSRSGGGDPFDGVRTDAPLSDGSGWAARLASGRTYARAVCVPNAEAPRVASGPVSGYKATSTATCPSGTRAVGGGYNSHGWFKDGYGESQDAVIASAPTANGTGWYAIQFEGRVEARALCR
ncbi:hypothetical protein [Spongiactinospora sp. 9N601]|uniref:hypothetical protein n=1 Tax=Spongiactinospora sp. 9N601 TaxID=3375149 RepID=UPI0037894143